MSQAIEEDVPSLWALVVEKRTTQAVAQALDALARRGIDPCEFQKQLAYRLRATADALDTFSAEEGCRRASAASRGDERRR